MLVAAGLVVASQAGAQVVLNPTSGRVSIRASGTPLSSLLDQLAQKTGMAVEYEKAPPRQAVSLIVEDRTPAQAVVAILEGLNIPYALSLTPDGVKVQTLVIADASPPPKGAHPRVGRETSMTQPDDTPPPEAQPQEGTEANPAEAPEEASQAMPQGRRAVPTPPPATLPSAFPNSPFGDGAEATPAKPEAKPEKPEAPPQPPQAQKEPQV